MKNVKFFILIEFDFLKIIGTYAISHVASEVETNAESSGTELSREANDEMQLNLELGGRSIVIYTHHSYEKLTSNSLYQHRQEVQI